MTSTLKVNNVEIYSGAEVTINELVSNSINVTGGSITGITDLAVADGGTGASTAAGALTNLGLTATATELNYTDGVTSAIQTQLDNKQPLDSDLTTIAALSHTQANVIMSNGSAWVSASPFRKNAIINGDFNVWQRGTSFAAVGNQYTADQWSYQKNGAMVHTVSRSTDVPSVATAGRLLNYSFLVDCTTVDTSLAAADYCFIGHKIEGYNWLPLAQRPTVLSFCVKATKTGIYCVSIGGSDRRYIGEYTVNSTNAWEKKTVTFTASPSAGTWDYTTGIGCAIRFVLAAGADIQATGGEWVTTATYAASATSNQINACDDVANNFLISGVQFETGSVATEFEQRMIQDEELFCKRYYNDIGIGSSPAIGIALGTTDIPVGYQYIVPMRVAPTVTLYDGTNNADRIHRYGVGDHANAATASGIGTESFLAILSTGLTAGAHYTARIRLVAEL
jgi:hypothetical protein